MVHKFIEEINDQIKKLESKKIALQDLCGHRGVVSTQSPTAPNKIELECQVCGLTWRRFLEKD